VHRTILAVVLTVVLPVLARAVDDPVVAHLRPTPTEAVVEIAIAPGWHVNSHTPHEEFLIPTTVEVLPPAGVTAGEVLYPKAVDRVLAFSGGKAMALYEGTVKLTAPLSGTAAKDAGPLRAKLRYQACNDTTCLPPKTVDLVAEQQVARAGVGGADEIADFVQRWGWGVTFLWVALLGLALNLTPCVYPMISVTIAFFGGRTADSGSRVVFHALLYVLGICVTFSTLGAAAALTGSLFGAALQNSFVLAGIALLMVALALSNFGLYQFRMPNRLMQWAGQSGEGALGAFFMGATMGVVGAPCIGTIVAALLLFVGSQQSAPLGVALFFPLGLGLGLPYVGLALVAGRLRRLPRGGAWLGWMEWFFGFVLLGLALYFATPLLAATVVRILWAVLLATAGVVLGFFGAGGSAGVRALRGAAGAAVVVFGLSGLLVAETESPIVWTPYSEVALTEATAAGRPVLIDFQAQWCMPCREMEKTTFRDPEVVRATRGFTNLLADMTAQDDAAEKLMERYTVPGVPTYVLLGADGKEKKRFVGFVPVEEMLDGLRLAAGEEARG
jgi:thiol:disulfide interchange protein DsbD